MKRFLWLGFVVSFCVICSGCGETFRPIIIPNPPQFPNPAASHSVVSINDNGTIVPGAQADSLTKLNFGGTVISSTSTISLPENSAPNFVATTESSQAYVLMPNYLDPTTNVVVPSIQVVNTSANNLAATVPVGNNPDAMVETPNAQKLYVANQADSTI